MTNEQLYLLLKTISDGLDSILADFPEQADRVQIYTKSLKPEYKGRFILNTTEGMYEETEEYFDEDNFTRLYKYAEDFRDSISVLTAHE